MSARDRDQDRDRDSSIEGRVDQLEALRLEALRRLEKFEKKPRPPKSRPNWLSRWILRR